MDAWVAAAAAEAVQWARVRTATHFIHQIFFVAGHNWKTESCGVRCL